jgi:hypothetical protein
LIENAGENKLSDSDCDKQIRVLEEEQVIVNITINIVGININ